MCGETLAPEIRNMASSPEAVSPEFGSLLSWLARATLVLAAGRVRQAGAFCGDLFRPNPAHVSELPGLGAGGWLALAEGSGAVSRRIMLVFPRARMVRRVW